MGRGSTWTKLFTRSDAEIPGGRDGGRAAPLLPGQAAEATADVPAASSFKTFAKEVGILRGHPPSEEIERRLFEANVVLRQLMPGELDLAYTCLCT